MLVALPALLSVLVVPAGPRYYLLVILAGASANASVPLLIVSAQDMAPGSMGAATGMLMGFTWGTAGVLYMLEGVLQQFLGLTPAMISPSSDCCRRRCSPSPSCRETGRGGRLRRRGSGSPGRPEQVDAVAHEGAHLVARRPQDLPRVELAGRSRSTSRTRAVNARRRSVSVLILAMPSVTA